MLLIHYSLLVLKQLVRIRIAFFFTLILPVLLYIFNGDSKNPYMLISFFNFAMQSAMLQSVGMFASAYKNTAWGQFVSTLPAPPLYSALGMIIAMYIVGVSGVVLIGGIDLLFFHTLRFYDILFALACTTLGALPMGALGYLVGTTFDSMSARNILIVINLAFLSMTFVSASLQNMLAKCILPNIWLDFSWSLVFKKQFNLYEFTLLALYFIGFMSLIKVVGFPRRR